MKGNNNNQMDINKIQNRKIIDKKYFNATQTTEYPRVKE